MDYSLLFAVEKFTRETLVGPATASNFAINEEEKEDGPVRSESFKK